MTFDLEHEGETYPLEMPDDTAMEISRRRLESRERITVNAMPDFKGTVFHVICGEMRSMVYYPKRLQNTVMLALKQKLEMQVNSMNMQLGLQRRL